MSSVWTDIQGGAMSIAGFKPGGKPEINLAHPPLFKQVLLQVGFLQRIRHMELIQSQQTAKISGYQMEQVLIHMQLIQIRFVTFTKMVHLF